MKITITGLIDDQKQRITDAICVRYKYPETVFDPSTPEFIQDPNDPEAKLMVPLEERQKPNPMTKWAFVSEAVRTFLSETIAGFEADRDVGANDIAQAARTKAKEDFKA